MSSYVLIVAYLVVMQRLAIPLNSIANRLSNGVSDSIVGMYID
jgi:hypothetical protein